MRWLIPTATAMWAFWGWIEEREQHRIAERERISAFCVNPFLSACEDLQSCIHNILKLERLHALRKRCPEHGYAQETLYLIVWYFGWTASIFRYGLYTRDPEVIRLTEAVRTNFAPTPGERKNRQGRDPCISGSFIALV
jgi:hypothetical protein